MAKLRILKTGKYCLHPSNGPIAHLKKGVIESDSIGGCDSDAIECLINDKWAEIVEDREQPESVEIDLSGSLLSSKPPKRGRGRPPLNG